MFYKINYNLRLIAVVLSSAMLMQDAALAAPDIAAAVSAPMSAGNPLSAYGIPSSVAIAGDSFLGTNDGKDLPRFILIEDAHTNPSGQINLASTLDAVLSKHQLNTVLTEGSDRDVSLSELRRYGTPRTRAKAVMPFVRKGELKGSEFLELTSNRDFAILGVEDRELYDRAVGLYARAAIARRSNMIALERLDAAARAVGEKLLNPRLAGFRAKLGHNDPTVAASSSASYDTSATDHLALLAVMGQELSIEPADMNQLKNLERIQKLEKSIDLQRASDEWAEAVARLPIEEREALKAIEVAAARRNNLEAMSAAGARLRKALGNKPARGELGRYLRYLKAIERLDPHQLLKQADRLERLVIERLAVTSDEKRFVRLDRALRHLKSLADLALTPAGHAYLEEIGEDARLDRIAGFLNRQIMALGLAPERAVLLEQARDSELEAARDFYRIAAERDRAILGRALAAARERGLTHAALITGGFHTPNLTALLRERGIAYRVITPQVYEETDRLRYERILLRRAVKNQSRGGAKSTLMTDYTIEDPVMFSALNGVISALPHQNESAPLGSPQLNPARMAEIDKPIEKILPPKQITVVFPANIYKFGPMVVNYYCLISALRLKFPEARIRVSMNQWYQPAFKGLVPKVQMISPLNNEQLSKIKDFGKGEHGATDLWFFFEGAENYGPDHSLIDRIREKANVIILPIVDASLLHNLELNPKPETVVGSIETLWPLWYPKATTGVRRVSGFDKLYAPNGDGFSAKPLAQGLWNRTINTYAALGLTEQRVPRDRIIKHRAQAKTSRQLPPPILINVSAESQRKLLNMTSKDWAMILLHIRRKYPNSPIWMAGIDVGAPLPSWYANEQSILLEYGKLTSNYARSDPLKKPNVIALRHWRGGHDTSYVEDLEKLKRLNGIVVGYDTGFMHFVLPFGVRQVCLVSSRVDPDIWIPDDPSIHKVVGTKNIMDLQSNAPGSMGAAIDNFWLDPKIGQGSKVSEESVAGGARLAQDIGIGRTGTKRLVTIPLPRWVPFLRRAVALWMRGHLRGFGDSMGLDEEIFRNNLDEVFMNGPLSLEISRSRYYVLEKNPDGETVRSKRIKIHPDFMGWQTTWREVWERSANEAARATGLNGEIDHDEVLHRANMADFLGERVIGEDGRRISAVTSARIVEGRTDFYQKKYLAENPDAGDDPDQYPSVESVLIPMAGGDPIPGHLVLPARAKRPGNTKVSVVIIYHGFSMSGANSYSDGLEEKLLLEQGFAVLRPDLLSHGLSNRAMRGKSDLKAYNNALAAFIKLRGGPRGELNGERVGIYGFSFGGYLALRAVLQSDLRKMVKSLVLMNPPTNETFSRFRIFQWHAGLLRALLIVDDFQRMVTLTQRRFMMPLKRVVGGVSKAKLDLLGRITLIIKSDHDGTIHYKDGDETRYFAEKIGARVEVLKDQGHFPKGGELERAYSEASDHFGQQLAAARMALPSDSGGLIFSQNVVDYATEPRDGHVVVRDGFNKLEQLLVVLKAQGFSTLYAYNMWDTGASQGPHMQRERPQPEQFGNNIIRSRDSFAGGIHTVPSAGPYTVFSKDGLTAVRVDQYAVHREVRADGTVLDDSVGNPFSPLDVGRLHRGMLGEEWNDRPDAEVQEELNRRFKEFLKKADGLGIKVHTDFMGWRSPAAVNSSNYEMFFYRELPAEKQKEYAGLETEEERMVWISKLLEHAGPWSAHRITDKKNNGKERVILVRRFKFHGMDSGDQVPVNPYHLGGLRYLIDSLLWMQEAGVDGVRVDLGHLMEPDSMAFYFREIENELLKDGMTLEMWARDAGMEIGEDEKFWPWFQSANRFRRPLRQILSEVKSRAKDGKPFIFNIETYEARDRDNLINLGVDGCYKKIPFEILLEIAKGKGDVLELARELQWVIGDKPTAVVFPSNFDQIAMKAVGDPEVHKAIEMLMITLGILGVPVIVDGREISGRSGHLVKISGGNPDRNDESHHPFLSDEELKAIKIDPVGHYLDLIKKSPWSALQKKLTQLTEGGEPEEIRLLNNSDQGRFIVILWKAKGRWFLSVSDFRPRAGKLKDDVLRVEVPWGLEGLDYRAFINNKPVELATTRGGRGVVKKFKDLTLGQWGAQGSERPTWDFKMNQVPITSGQDGGHTMLLNLGKAKRSSRKVKNVSAAEVLRGYFPFQRIKSFERVLSDETTNLEYKRDVALMALVDPSPTVRIRAANWVAWRFAGNMKTPGAHPTIVQPSKLINFIEEPSTSLSENYKPALYPGVSEYDPKRGLRNARYAVLHTLRHLLDPDRSEEFDEHQQHVVQLLQNELTQAFKDGLAKWTDREDQQIRQIVRQNYEKNTDGRNGADQDLSLGELEKMSILQIFRMIVVRNQVLKEHLKPGVRDTFYWVLEAVQSIVPDIPGDPMADAIYRGILPTNGARLAIERHESVESELEFAEKFLDLIQPAETVDSTGGDPADPNKIQEFLDEIAGTVVVSGAHHVPIEVGGRLAVYPIQMSRPGLEGPSKLQEPVLARPAAARMAIERRARGVDQILRGTIDMIEKMGGEVVVRMRPGSFTRDLLIDGGDIDGLTFYTDGVEQEVIDELKAELDRQLRSARVVIAPPELVQWKSLDESSELYANPEHPFEIYYDKNQRDQINNGYLMSITFDPTDLLRVHWQTTSKILARIKLMRLLGLMDHAELQDVNYATEDPYRRALVNEMLEFSRRIDSGAISLTEEDKRIVEELNRRSSALSEEENPLMMRSADHAGLPATIRKLIGLGLVTPNVDANKFGLVWQTSYPQFELPHKLFEADEKIADKADFSKFNSWADGAIEVNDWLEAVPEYLAGQSEETLIQTRESLIASLGSPSAVRAWDAYERLLADKGSTDALIRSFFEYIDIDDNDRYFSHEKDVRRVLISLILSLKVREMDLAQRLNFISRVLDSQLMNPDQPYGYTFKYFTHFIQASATSEWDWEAHERLRIRVRNRLEKYVERKVEIERQDQVHSFERGFAQEAVYTLNSNSGARLAVKNRTQRAYAEGLIERLRLQGVVDQNLINKLFELRGLLDKFYNAAIAPELLEGRLYQLYQLNQLVPGTEGDRSVGASEPRLEQMTKSIASIIADDGMPPSILALQEVTHVVEGGRERINTAKAIADRLNYDIWEKISNDRHGSFSEGLAIVYDRSFSRIGAYQLSLPDQRMLIGVKLKSRAEKEFYVFTGHLSWQPDDEGKRLRSMQLSEIRKFIGDNNPNNSPVIFAGDLNFIDEIEIRASQEALGSNYLDAYRQLHLDPLANPGATYNSINPLVLHAVNRRTDIAYLSGATPLSSDLALDHSPFVSDHYALRTVFALGQRGHDSDQELDVKALSDDDMALLTASGLNSTAAQVEALIARLRGELAGARMTVAPKVAGRISGHATVEFALEEAEASARSVRDALQKAGLASGRGVEVVISAARPLDRKSTGQPTGKRTHETDQDAYQDWLEFMVQTWGQIRQEESESNSGLVIAYNPATTDPGLHDKFEEIGIKAMGRANREGDDEPLLSIELREIAEATGTAPVPGAQLDGAGSLRVYYDSGNNDPEAHIIPHYHALARLAAGTARAEVLGRLELVLRAWGVQAGGNTPSIVTANGIVTGTITDPETLKTYSFKGSVLQGFNAWLAALRLGARLAAIAA